MWQRVQTVFLVISIIALLVSLVMPIWIYSSGTETQVLTPFYLMKPSTGENGTASIHTYMPYSVTAMFAVAAITLTIIEITKFKSRVTQMKIGALNSFFLVGVLMCSFLFSNQLSKLVTQGAGEYGIAMWLPGISVFCNLLANRFIRRDEKLVRDSNRLR